MRKEDSEQYSHYAASAPFMLPIPKRLAAAIMLPAKLVLKKERPETGKELLATFAIYATLLVLLSLPFVLLDFPPGVGWSGWPGYLPGTL